MKNAKLAHTVSHLTAQANTRILELENRRLPVHGPACARGAHRATLPAARSPDGDRRVDTKRRAAIIKTLVNGKFLDKYSSFDPNYSPQNRVWFVSAIVDAVINAFPRPDDDKVEGLAREIIGDANYAVMLDRELEPSVGLDIKLRKTERKDVVRRVEAIYGVFAQKKELVTYGVETSRSKLLVALRKFVASRRYRGVVRMIYQVNPNSNGFMRYPHECETDQHWRVNVDAQPLWKKTGTFDVPLTVADNAAPDVAAKQIWEKPFLKGHECEGNLLDCANAACCILMDTLFEAADPAMFLKAIQQRAPGYLLIVNPNKEQGTHFLWDKETEWHNVFSKELVREADFQIGDHVVVQNHGLYLSLIPQGLWSAEHSLVTNLGNRNASDGKGLRFGGHGLDDPFSMATIYDDLIKTLQTHLHRIYTIADLFLRFMRDPTDPAGIPQGQVATRPNLEVKDPRTQKKIKFDGYELYFDFVYDNYRKPPKGGKRPTLKEGEGANPVVVFDIKQNNEIAIAPTTEKNTILDQMAKMNTSEVPIMIFIQRVPGTPAPGENYYARAAWQVPYVDAATNKGSFHPLFGGPGGTFKQLERKQMPTGDGRYFRADPESESGATITRPNVDTDDAYLNYLAGISAI
jgi:hypothetical protein